MYNFGEFKTKVAELVQRSGDDSYKTKIGVWLQLSHKLLSEIYDYWDDLKDIYNFTTVSGREDYFLPNRFDKPLRLFDLTNDNKMTLKTEEEYFEENISSIADSTTGTPDVARIYGVSGSTIAISSSGNTVKAKSSASSESAAIIVRVGGYIDSAFLIEDFENITVPASGSSTFVAGTKTFYKITHISKSANTSGYITVANSGGTTLETLAPNERVARHKVLKLGLIPNAAISMRLLFKRIPYEMVSDYDYPFTECDRFLILDSLGWALKQDTKDQEAEYTWTRATEALRILLNNQASKLGPDYQNKIVSNFLAAHRNR